MIDLSTDDGVAEALQAIAAWPAPTEHRVLHVVPRGARRSRSWWVALAAAVAVLAGTVAAVRRDAEPPVSAATGSWETMAPSPLPARFSPATVWTGTEMIVWGGFDADGTERVDGAAYDPATDMWRRIADFPFNQFRRDVPVDQDGTSLTADVPSVWVGDRAVFRVIDPVETWAWRMVSYTPATDEWETVYEARFDQLPSGALVPAAGDGPVHTVEAMVAWRDLVVALGWRSDLNEYGWATFDPRETRWSEFTGLPESGELSGLLGSSAPALDGDRLLWLHDGITYLEPFGYAIDLATGVASAIEHPYELGSAVRVDVSGSVAVGLSAHDDGSFSRVAFRYDAASSSLTVVTPPPGGPADTNDFFGLHPSFVDVPDGSLYIGGIELDGRYGGLRSITAMYASDAEVTRWSGLPDAPIDLNRLGMAAIWTGREVIVWGGSTVDPVAASNAPTVPLADGARYVLQP